MDTIRLGSVEASRFVLGGNPFSGFSHQGPEANARMQHYYTAARVKETLRAAEAAGITAFLGRTDRHIARILMEYWDEGGRLAWIAQTCPGVAPTEQCVDLALGNGAKAIFIHGGVMDHCLARGDMADPLAGIEKIRAAGLPVGVAGHDPAVFRWAEREGLDLDFYMCSYYNSAHRDKSAEKLSNQPEWFLEEDRHAMAATIRDLPRPVIHYKVLAAGRNDPADALAFTARTMRPTDAVCVGIYTKDNPDMVAEDVRLFEKALARRETGA